MIGMDDPIGRRLRAGVGMLRDLPLSQSAIDYDVAGRERPSVIDEALADPSTRVVLVNSGLLAVRRRAGSHGVGALECADDPAAPRPDAVAPAGGLELALLAGPEVREEALGGGRLVVYLGVDRASEPVTRYLALDIGASASAPRRGRASVDRELDGARDTLASRALKHLDGVELRSFAPCASLAEAGLATSAVAVTAWHASQRFCPACGAPVEPALAGWAQVCTGSSDGSRLLFPRIEPAVITAFVDDDDRLLLQHNTAWRDSFLSVSAGFVEAGESLEHAVRREAAEEVGLELGELCYLGSQAWPFPSSIMLAFRAHALGTDVAVDHGEVAFARWYSRDELARSVEAGELELPGRSSFARLMIELW